jgi:hypothetical protein
LIYWFAPYAKRLNGWRFSTKNMPIPTFRISNKQKVKNCQKNENIFLSSKLHAQLLEDAGWNPVRFAAMKMR